MINEYVTPLPLFGKEKIKKHYSLALFNCVDFACRYYYKGTGAVIYPIWGPGIDNPSVLIANLITDHDMNLGYHHPFLRGQMYDKLFSDGIVDHNTCLFGCPLARRKNK